MLVVQGRSRQGSWVISGGVGALGGLMAAWFAHECCRDITLLSRSGHFQSQDNTMQHLLCGQQIVKIKRCGNILSDVWLLSASQCLSI